MRITIRTYYSAMHCKESSQQRLVRNREYLNMQVKDSVLVSRAQTTPTKMGSALPIFVGVVWGHETNSVYVHVHVLPIFCT